MKVLGDSSTSEVKNHAFKAFLNFRFLAPKFDVEIWENSNLPVLCIANFGLEFLIFEAFTA